MSSPASRLSLVTAHLSPPGRQQDEVKSLPPHLHTLSPTYLLPRAATIEPDAPAIYHITTNGTPIRRTYQAFADRARGFAYFLKKHNLSRVGILCPNTPAFLELLFAIPAAGGVSVGVNYRLKPEDIRYIFEHADVDSIVVDAELVDLLAPFRKANPNVRIVVDTDADEGVGEYEKSIVEGLAHDAELGACGWDGLQAQAADENGLLSLAYTSGTTSRPKGVEFTHRGVYLAALGNVIEGGLSMSGQQCRYLWTLPLFHATGWTFPWAITAVRGMHVCLRKIDYPLIWKLLKNEGITHFSAAPTVNTLLCADVGAAPLDRPVKVTVAGSAPTAHLFETMARLNLQPVHVYGLTESYGPLTKSYYLPEWDRIPVEEKFKRMARQGHGFITSLAARVIKVPTDDDGSAAAAATVQSVRQDGTEIGEIAFQGNICARGYYKDPTATAKLFAGGVLHTGDLAVWHPDGAIEIMDRQKDIIISGGENISSVALEGMLVRHPAVLEAGVVAVPDERWGERPKAFVTVVRNGVKSEMAARTTTTGPEIVEWAKTKSEISKFMVPREVEIVAELPKTATGKIRKNDLREWAKSGVPADKRVG